MNKRIISGAAALVIALGCAGVPAVGQFAGVNTALTANAEEQETLTFGDFSYKVLSDDTVSITKYNGHDADVVIPDTIDGKPVTKINGFFLNYDIVSVTIPESVTTIGDLAFAYCRRLKNVVIPNSVTTIGESAFFVCHDLIDITIPESVTSIGADAFSCCFGLRSVLLLGDNTAFVKGSYGVEKGIVFTCYKNTDTEKNLKENGYSNIKSISADAPVVTTQIQGDAFRLNWIPVDGAENYGIWYYTGGKWRAIIKDISPETTSYTKMKVPYGTYKFLVAAKVNGEWKGAVSNAVDVNLELAYPKVLSVESAHQKLWFQCRAVPGAKSYVAAVKIDNKWKIIGESDNSEIYSDIELPLGTYEAVVLANVNGKLETRGYKDKVFNVTVNTNTMGFTYEVW